MRDRHSPWFSHNLELVLWGLTTFALMILLAQFARESHVSGLNGQMVGKMTAARQSSIQTAQSPEL